jgi:hypothetical protein
MSIDANELLMGGGSKAARFDGIGVTVTGRILDVTAKQQTDFTTGEPKFWPNGDAMYQVLVRLQTEQHEDGDDDGVRTLYVKGKSLTGAVREAVRGAGAKGLEVGGTLTVTYTGDGVSEKRGINPPKLYAAEYVKPDPAAAANQALGLAAPEPAAAQPAPVAAPAAAAAPDLSALGPEAQALIASMLAKQQQTA